MEYVRQRGAYSDLPLEEIIATFEIVYGGTLSAPGSWQQTISWPTWTANSRSRAAELAG